jgi:hypothetical protein
MTARSALKPAGGLAGGGGGANARDWSQINFVDLLMGNPAGVTYGNNEELERKARPRLAGMRPKTKYQSKHQLPAAYANRYSQTLRQRLKSALGMLARSALKPAGGGGVGYVCEKLSLY